MIDGGAGTPRNTAATDGASDDLLKAIRSQQASKTDVQGNLLESFKGLDFMSGPAGTPRSTANTGDLGSLLTASDCCRAFVKMLVRNYFTGVAW